MSRIYQLNLIKKLKIDCNKQLMNDIKMFLKKNKRKRKKMVVKVTKISQKTKNKSLLSIEKKYYRIRNSFSFQICVYIEDIVIRINVCISF